jgi:hypothetical protein
MLFGFTNTFTYEYPYLPFDLFTTIRISYPPFLTAADVHVATWPLLRGPVGDGLGGALADGLGGPVGDGLGGALADGLGGGLGGPVGDGLGAL